MPSVSSTGERRNRRTIRRRPVSGRAAYSRSTSTLRPSPLSSSGSTTTSQTSPSSRSSGFVNAACSAPRRPTTTTSCTELRAKASIAWSAVSVTRRSSSGSTSIRATSSATLPLPITTARSCVRSNCSSAKSGWPLYQPTNAVAGRLSSSPGMPSGRSADGAGGVDDRVVALGELGARDVTPELDAAEEAEARVRGDLLEHARDGLDLRVVGRHAGAHETPGRGQAVDHVDRTSAPFSSCPAA